MKAYKRLSILCIAVLLCALLPVLAGATSSGDPPETVDPNAVYVRANGNDNGAGSQEDPYATLAKAVEKADDGATIELLSNLTTSKLALISEKSITIDGNGFTITRAEGFERGLDTGRGAYHPAMIEVANGSELRLENIILDDDFKQEQNEYKEQLTGDGDKENASKVQDAIIAAYGDGKGTIILGQGTTLKNFGGMSAVRIGGNTDDDGVWYGSTLIMEAGSKIIDDSLGNREGGVAAIWSQGGKIEMEEGSSIEKIDGRAIYLEDGGNATVNGSIQNITANGVMTSDPAKGSDLGGGASGGFGGIAVAALGNSHFTLESAGSISDIKTDPNDVRGGDVAIWLAPGSFIMEENSRMENIQTIGLVDNNGGIIEIGGTVSNCELRNIFFRMRGTQSTFILQETGTITNCTTSDAALIYLNGGKPTIEIAGTIDGIDKPALFISNNGSNKDGSITLTETGVITNVDGYGIRLEDPSKVTIEGTITNCSSYALQYYPKGDQSLLTIKSTATIKNNNGGMAQVRAQNSLPATNAQEHIVIEPGGLDGNKTVDLTAFDVTLDEDYAAVKLGNANAAAFTAIKNELSTNPDYTEWETYGSSAIWMQPSESSFHFTTDRPKGFLGIGGIEPGRGLYVAYVPLQADGTPDADAEVKLEEIVNQETLDITLDNLTAGTSYAVMLVMSDEYVLRPDDITIYTGGDEEGFPSWTMENTKPEKGAVRVGEDTTSYTLDNLEKLFTVSYYDSEGTALTDDHTPGVYAARFNLSDAASASLTIESDGSVTGLTIGGNTVRVADGTLTIRYVSDEDEASDNELTEPVVSQVPETLEDMAVAVIQDDATYHTNGSNSGLGESNGEIHLMFDDLLPTGTGGASTDRIQMLIEKAESDNVLSFDGMDYQFKYLDLVDYSNGNAWVSTDKDIIIYWPYPAGTDQDTKFTLLHFTGLHREYSLGSEEDLTSQINASVIETVSVTNTDQGIQFTLQGDAENGSFSPFALVWEESAVTPPPVTPSEPADPDDTGVSDLLDTENHNQYLFGYPEGTFGPDQNMTRAEVAQMFYNLLVDKNVAITATFEDVPADAWYAKSVNTLASMGIISGVGENRFEPERSITRAEFTSMAMKFTKGALDGTNVFSDVHSGDWFYEAVVGSIQYGWIEGYEDGTFRPENWITRVEVTSIVNKMLGRFADREFVAGHADELNAFSDVTSTHWGYYHIVEATNSHTYTKPSTNVETWTELK